MPTADTQAALELYEEARRMNEALQTEITERRRTEEALRETEEVYRAVVENVADAIVINVGTKRVFVNKAFAQMVGLDDMSQVLGCPLEFHNGCSGKDDITRMRAEYMDTQNLVGLGI